MKTLLLAIASLLALSACDDLRSYGFKQAPPKESVEAREARTITYVKDSRTELCFVVNYVSGYPIGGSNIYSNVPCSPAVEALLPK